MFVLAPVSSTNTSRPGWRVGITPARHAARCRATSGRSCSSARSTFFERQTQPAQGPPDGNDGHGHAEAVEVLGGAEAGLSPGQFGEAVAVVGQGGLGAG